MPTPPNPVRNVLYIMCDQLRRDYLSCYGHPHLHTPNIDRLAAAGVRFSRAYTQGTICGPSRMSAYTGRYVSSHQVAWNAVPLPLEELTIGDYLRPHGIRTALVGKTHATANVDALQRLAINPDSEQAEILNEVGFEPYMRHDGIYPRRSAVRRQTRIRALHPLPARARFRRQKSLARLGQRRRRRKRRNPQRLENASCEFASTNSRATLRDCLHYKSSHRLHHRARREIVVFTPLVYQTALALHRTSAIPRHVQYEIDSRTVRATPSEASKHPVYTAFRQHEESLNFSRDSVRLTVIPTYMGLIKQVDDQLGRLFDFLQSNGRWDDTLIVFTSDHGDFLGDHWLGEKEFLLEQAVGVPLIVRDPRTAADVTRGTVDDRLAETIDALPTFLQALGIAGGATSA
jgi:arylsulfatase A-like enzyme